jgi:prevent-host-death family protein
MEMKIQVEEAAVKFQEIMRHVLQGKDVILVDKQKPVARIVPIASEKESQGDDRWTSDDFDIQVSKDL